jgi:hypothetical protein
MSPQQEEIQSDRSALRLQLGGRREEFNLRTANKSITAHKARQIYEFLRANGWGAFDSLPDKRRALALEAAK